MNKKEKQQYLNDRLIPQILNVLANGFGNESNALIRSECKKISCSEAVEVLENTIAKVKEIPLDFNH